MRGRRPPFLLPPVSVYCPVHPHRSLSQINEQLPLARRSGMEGEQREDKTFWALHEGRGSRTQMQKRSLFSLVVDLPQWIALFCHRGKTLWRWSTQQNTQEHSQNSVVDCLPVFLASRFWLFQFLCQQHGRKQLNSVPAIVEPIFTSPPVEYEGSTTQNLNLCCRKLRCLEQNKNVQWWRKKIMLEVILVYSTVGSNFKSMLPFYWFKVVCFIHDHGLCLFSLASLIFMNETVFFPNIFFYLRSASNI